MPRITLATAIPLTLFIIVGLLMLLRHTEVVPSHYLTFEHWKPGRGRPWKSRLNLTLEGNEQRYMEIVENRAKLLEELGGPKIPAFPEPHSQFYTLWDFVVPGYSCPFPVYRVGTLGDGGKWVCGLERVLDKPECVVYSMGVEKQSSFEVDVLSRFQNCQIYGFDYTVNEWGPQLLSNETLLPRAHFRRYRIGGIDDHDHSPKLYTMAGIMKEFGHGFVDILKMDIEGSEFFALLDIIKQYKGQPLPFGQLQLEIHFGYTWDMETVGDFLGWWKVLEDAGLRPFWTEINSMHVNNFRSAPTVAEWSFINIRGHHALVDERLAEYP